MKHLFILLLVFTKLASAQVENNLNCDNVLDFTKYKGTTFLNFMEQKGKPILDRYATKGYPVRSSRQVLEALENVDPKVKRKVISAVGKDKNLLVSLIDKLEGKTVDLYNLPTLIAKAEPKLSRNRYNLSTFVGLASCGGLIMKFAPGNYAYNIHYGTGYNPKIHNTPELKEKHRKDKQTGRSFGEAPGRFANDASDKAYLTDLEKYVVRHSDDIKDFYLNLFAALGNSDTTYFSSIDKEGQAVLTDFLAVYTAEQARNLMDNKVSLHWDAALLEVTLLAAFHAGQESLELFFRNPNNSREILFTDSVLNQAPCRGLEEGRVSGKSRAARLYDYWQFSSSPSEEHCRRSGINITKEEFRKLGEIISKYERKMNPQLVKNLESHFYVKNRGGNVFLQASKHFINPYTPKKLGKEAYDLAEDFTKFLLQVRSDAKEISKLIKNGEL